MINIRDKSKHITILPATKDHIPGIIEVWKQLMDFHRDINPFFARSRKGHIHFGKYVEELIESDQAQVLVATENVRVIAYSIALKHTYPPIFERRECGFISDLAVRSGYRRQGIGSRMLEKMVEWFSSLHLERIELRAVPENQIGYAFWKKNGFKEYMHVLYLNHT